MLLALCGCFAPRTERFSLPSGPQERQVRVPRSCGDWRGYLPDPAHPEYLPVRYLRVNFHIMNNRAGNRNFTPAEARPYFRRFLETANAQLDTNLRNWRSPENTAVLPRRYRYVIAPQPGDDGFYFHYDDSLYYFVSQGKNQNNYSRKVIDKYAVGKDSILNIFVMVHHEDSIRSKTYRANGQGIALGTALKIAVIYDPQGSTDSYIGLFNHEVGHILGLSHAWVEDGCPDTDNHPNKCWMWSEQPPCRDLATNNMMDYNAYQIALTPCQIGRIHTALANEKNPVRRLLRPTWCRRNPDQDVVVRDSAVWDGARDLEGNLTVAPGGALRLSCRLSMPAGSSLTVQPGGRLWLDGAHLHNACGLTWKGILVQTAGERRGEVHVLKQPLLENIPAEKSRR